MCSRKGDAKAIENKKYKSGIYVWFFDDIISGGAGDVVHMY